MRSGFLLGIMICALFTSALAQGAPSRLICDFDQTTVPWYSKFSKAKVATVDRDGKHTNALLLAYDLSQEPHYDWFRTRVPDGIDVRPYKYLTFRLKADGEGARLLPMLMQSVPKGPGNPNGEAVAAAEHRFIDLNFTGWRQFSVPLASFNGIDAIAAKVQMINFSLQPGATPSRAAELWLDDLRLTTAPEGTLVEEQIPFPPADIAIANDADFFGALDLTRPDLKDVRAAVEAKDWKAARAAWASHLATRTSWSERTSPQWVWSRRDKAQIMALFDAKFGGLKHYVPEADRVLDRDFNWLGVRKHLKKNIDWMQGPNEWTHVLSRFAYWEPLGYAYWATGDRKYAADFVSTMEDWIADNPVPRILTNSNGKHGNVWRTLETGIRGDDWFDAMELFMDAPEFDADAKYLMTKSLAEHARHLYRYETEFRYGNWQVVECTGLACIGIMLPEFKEAPQWRERAFHYLVEHMQKDVYPDGAHHEVTPGYHSWVMERFLKIALLCQRNGYKVPGLLERHEKMFEFLEDISKPDHRFPPLGDAGSGGSIEGWMGIGALLYNRPDMRYLAVNDIQPGWVWLFGPDVVKRYADLPSHPPAFTSLMMPDAKYCTMRTGWQKDDKYLLFDCAPWGGGHSHEDQLQVIAYAGRDLLVDPGQYSYDEPLSRTYFRTSEAHNVLLIDNHPQGTGDPKVVAWTTTADADFVSGEMDDAQRGLRHQRCVLFVKPDYWVVVDYVFGKGDHELTRRFHFPLVQVTPEGHTARTTYPTGANVAVTNLDSAALTMRDGWIPTGGATAQKAPVAAFDGKQTLPAALCTVIVPFTQAAQLPKVERITGGDPMVVALHVTFPDGRADDVAIAPEPTDLKLGDRTAHARTLIVRTGNGHPR